MAELHRTQILLTLAQQRYLKGRAERESRSVSEIVRELVNAEMEDWRQAIKDDPFWDIVGMVAGGDPDAGVEHDHYVYGTPRKGQGNA
jgi:hypothetical protein